jgi:DNA-binding beta-propeller fold protein YncE
MVRTLALVLLLAVVVPGVALGAGNRPATPPGSLQQLSGVSGCLVDRSKPIPGCTRVRALDGPAPFLGSEGIAASPDGKNVYVASSKSNAIAVFRRDSNTGQLSQERGASGCVAERGAERCGEARGLRGPNSVAVSPNGLSVYATAVGSDSVAVFRRNPRTGALAQAAGPNGCIANGPTPGCAPGRALRGADVVVVSPDGSNVYVGSFFDNAVAVFARNPLTGALNQPPDETGCIAETQIGRCTNGMALLAPEGMAISADGNTVYAATALSNALVVLNRDSGGALTQATDGSGCFVDAPRPGCTTATQLGGANAVAISPGDDSVYVTTLFSNTVTSFIRLRVTGRLIQSPGTSACAINVLAVGCSLARHLVAPEGVTASPDGLQVYASAFGANAIDIFNRKPSTGGLLQAPPRAGCVIQAVNTDCLPARALRQASATAISPDGNYLYSAAFKSNAVGVFKRVR